MTIQQSNQQGQKLSTPIRNDVDISISKKQTPIQEPKDETSTKEALKRAGYPPRG